MQKGGNIMNNLLLLPLFALYNITLMSYAAHVFDYRKKLLKIMVITTVINTLLFGLSLTVMTAQTEIFFMLGYIVLYAIEFKPMAKTNYPMLFFGVLSFALNITSRRILVVTIFALIFDRSILDCYNDPTLLFWINALPYILSIPYILLTKKHLKKSLLDLMFTDRRNVSFAVGIMGSVYLYFCFIILFIDTADGGTSLIILYLMTAGLTSVSYHLAMAYALVFSRLKLHVMEYETIHKNICNERELIQTLEDQTEHDTFTGLHVRHVAEDEVAKLVAAHQAFYIAFLDMDGLKAVNDQYGHSEGDFYIQQVCDLIQKVFDTETISRLGGDEFLVVGAECDFYQATEKVVQCFEMVKHIQKQHQKPYQTSISYGMVHVGTDNQLTATQIIAQADQQMYQFKKSRKRQRKTVSLR